MPTTTRIMEAGEFFGDCIMHVKGREFGFYEYRYPADAGIPKHAHAHALVSMLVVGQYVERVGSEEREYCGRAIYHPPFEEHSESFGENGATLFGFHVPDELMLFLRECDLLVDQSRIGLCVRDTQAMLRIANLLRGSSKIEIFRAETTAMELLSGLPAKKRLCKERKKPGWLSTAVDLLNSDTDFSLRLSSLSRILCLNPSYLAREFRRWQGCSVGQYACRRRLEWAVSKVRDSDVEFARIAMEAGFADQSHLTRAIKQTLGVSPREIRRMTTSRIFSKPS